MIKTYISIVDKHPEWFYERDDFEIENNLPLSYSNMISNTNDTYLIGKQKFKNILEQNGSDHNDNLKNFVVFLRGSPFLQYSELKLRSGMC